MVNNGNESSFLVGLPVMVFVLERCEGLREGSNIVVLRDPDGFLFEANLLERDI